MSYSSVLSTRARKELSETWLRYEKQSSGVGDKFETEVFNRINQIKENPERYAEKSKNFRETKIKRFPFLIIYRIDKEQKIIVIQSIFHTSRNPKLKYKSQK